MRLICLFTAAALACLLSVFSLRAQQTAPEEMKQPRILILLDGSSSMLQPWDEHDSRFKAAGRLIIGLMDSIYRINDQVEFGLRVYGHQSPAQNNNCFDTRREVIFSKNNLTQMFLRLNSLEPRGVSPIAYSLKQAAEQDLSDESRNAYSIILVTDGGESCNGNICEVVKMLLDKKIFFKPYILSLVDYAPLKQQYDCLGTYLRIASSGEMTSAITTIMESYRKALLLPNIVAGPVQQPQAAPAPRPVQVIRTVIPKDTVAAVRPAQPAAVKQELPVVKQDLPPVRPSSPVVLPKDNVYVLPLRKSKPSFRVALQMPSPKKVKLNTYELSLEPVEAEPAPVAVVRPPSNTPVQPTRMVPVPAQPVRDEPAPAPKRNATSSFSTETEESKETMLEIFFTDGKGTFYKSTPQLELVDPRTKKVLHKFYRTVDANGNPDPQKIPAGTYDVVIPAKSSILASGVVVVDQKTNKIIIKVSTGSLRFAYSTSPGRPVKEYEALVTRRFDNLGPSIRQRCTAELEFAPGNYYVEVNTLPVTRFNTDIDFGSTTELKLPEPGFVQFTNTGAIGRVTLYHPLGDRYMNFYALDVTGDPNAQRLQLKPGAYEARFMKTPGRPYAQETVIKFLIKSNAITDVELQ